MQVLVFEDQQVIGLYPITVGRPAFEISCGACRLLDHLRALSDDLVAVVRPHLADVLSADAPTLVELARWHAKSTASGRPVLLVNARLVPSMATRTVLQEILDARQVGVARVGNAVAAALLPADALPEVAELTVGSLARWLSDCTLPSLDINLPLFQHPHDVIRHHLSSIGPNIEARIRTGAYQEIADNVFTTHATELSPHIATDTRRGPILLEEGGRIGPFAYLQGPLYIGHGAQVAERTSVLAYTSLGHTTKAGGEIAASIIEPFSNKQHYGFLGHSYVGSWVNLGAGTCTSDLKNTYGEIRIRHNGRKLSTGMQFLGAMIGDYAKTAVNTSIYTGVHIGTASLVYGVAASNVPSFVNYARLFGQVTTASVESLAAMQQRMFARRGRQQRGCDRALLQAMFELTESERQDVTQGTGPPTF